MRKLIANSVLLLILAVFFAPAFTNAASASVPLCCRRGGAHHCTAVAQVLDGRGISFRAAATCPMGHGPLLVSSVAALPASHSLAIHVEREAFLNRALKARCFSVSDSDHQRGPPERLL